MEEEGQGNVTDPRGALGLSLPTLPPGLSHDPLCPLAGPETGVCPVGLAQAHIKESPCPSLIWSCYLNSDEGWCLESRLLYHLVCTAPRMEAVTLLVLQVEVRAMPKTTGPARSGLARGLAWTASSVVWSPGGRSHPRTARSGGKAHLGALGGESPTRALSLLSPPGLRGMLSFAPGDSRQETYYLLYRWENRLTGVTCQ